MGPGNRRDTIDDAFGDWNWAKSCQIGEHGYRCAWICFAYRLPARVANVLLARAKIAIEERTRLRLCFEELHAALDAKITKPWEAMVTAWEADQSQPNPFELPPQGTTLIMVCFVRVLTMWAEYKELSALRKELAMEDAADVGSTEMVHNDISPSQFIYQGLEIEDSQCVTLYSHTYHLFTPFCSQAPSRTQVKREEQNRSPKNACRRTGERSGPKGCGMDRGPESVHAAGCPSSPQTGGSRRR